jgi:hypothetical protein
LMRRGRGLGRGLDLEEGWRNWGLEKGECKILLLRRRLFSFFLSLYMILYTLHCNNMEVLSKGVRFL